MVELVIAEKNKVAQNIACALGKAKLFLKICKECDNTRSCKFMKQDIFLVFRSRENCSEPDGLLRCLIDEANVESPKYFKCRKGRCRYSLVYTSEHKGRRLRGIKTEIERFLDQSQGSYESIKYYLIPSENPKYLILDTNGTMLSFGYGRLFDPYGEQMRNLEQDIKEVDIRQILWNLKYYANSGYEVRSYLFRAVLNEKIFGNIELIYVATDYDIAGAFIAHSLFKKSEKEGNPIDYSKIKRINIESMSEKGVMKAFNNPLEFDWGNAYAGNLRALFDYFFGSIATYQLNGQIRNIVEKNREFNRDMRRIPVLGVGRVQVPALSLVAKREEKLASESWDYFLYIACHNFEESGCRNTQELVQQLEDGKAACFKIVFKHNLITESDFIKMLSEHHVGTHTTRFAQIPKLQEKKLIRVKDGYISTTELGRAYLRIIGPELKTEQFDLASIEFNSAFDSVLESLKGSKEKAEDRFNLLLSGYLEAIRETLYKLGFRYESIAKQLAPYFINQIAEEKMEKIRVKGLQKETEKELDLWDQIRMSLAIPHGTDFEILECYPEPIHPLLIATHNLYRIVFRTKLNRSEAEEGLDVLIKKIIKDYHEKVRNGDLEETVVLGITEEEESKYSDDPAHSPIHVTDSGETNITYTPQQIRLINEIINSIESSWRRADEEQTLLGFNLWNRDFERAEYYPSSQTLNYEAALSLMNEKYGWPLEETGRMLEDLYLGVR
jgi:DNA topoisomerase IA